LDDDDIETRATRRCGDENLSCYLYGKRGGVIGR